VTGGSRRFAAALVVAALSAPGTAPADTLEFEFRGIVEPAASVAVSPRVDGVVEKVLFDGGKNVGEGDVLFVMDDAACSIAVDAARASLAEARARLSLAEDAADRQRALLDRGTGSRVAALEAEAALEVARAVVAAREATLARAQLDLARTRIVAPIAGRVGRPRVSPGAFVEAEAGSVLAEIVQDDPVLVAYAVPFQARLEALAGTGAADAREMFASVSLRLVLPGGEPYEHAGEPRFESARIDDGGTLTTWAVFPNPDGVLVPGLLVTILSTVAPSAEAAR